MQHALTVPAVLACGMYIWWQHGQKGSHDGLINSNCLHVSCPVHGGRLQCIAFAAIIALQALLTAQAVMQNQVLSAHVQLLHRALLIEL